MKLNNRTLGIAFIGFALAFLLGEFSRVGDFNIFLMASEALGEGKNIYTTTYVSGFHYYYSPLFAILITPLTWVSPYWASTLWNLFSFLLLARVFIVLWKLFFPHSRQQPLIFLLGFAGCIFPVYSNFHMTQMSVFILWAMLECLYQVQVKERHWLGGAILGLALSIKIMPIVMLPYLLFRGHFKAAVYSILTVAICVMLPVAFLGNDTSRELTASWLELINPAHKDHLLDLRERGFHSLTTLFAVLFSAESYEEKFGVARNLLSLDSQMVSVLINIVRLTLILSVLAIMRTKPFQKAQSAGHAFREVAYICLITPLIFPHQQTYGFLLILPAMLYLAYYFTMHWQLWKSETWFKITFSLALVSLLIINLELILGEFRLWYWYYKTLTYGVLMLLGVLVVCKPRAIL